VEIGLLTAIAIRGRPVKGLSLADQRHTSCGCDQALASILAV
jgi:hypothetical protein